MEKEEFLRLLPKLIVEDDQVKGAIITALSGVVSTKDDIKLVIAEFDKRFEALQLQIDGNYKELRSATDSNYKELRSAIDNFGSRSGRSSERMIIKLLQEYNQLKDVEISNIEQKEIIDEEGLVFPKGYRTDIDVLVENGKLILIEIKFKVDNRDIYHFVQVGKLYEKLFRKPDELWVLTFEISPKTLAASTKFPVKVIYGREK